MSRLLVIMGSGETAPTMIKPHRALFARTAGTGMAALLDTPYGFQENADDISRRAQSYFAASVGERVDVVTWRTAPEPGLAREQALASLRTARWIFAGPGSPTYALRQWRETPIPDLLRQRLADDGVVTFASAAALTLGSHTVPVYEIYKAGADPYWTPGLGLVEAVTGLPAVVIPHYDNAEGGHHDTRYCYLGERRLARLEQELPEDAFVLGVDEHTGCVLDLDARTATVLGNSAVTVRRHGHSTVFPTGAVLSFEELVGAGSTGDAPAPVAEPARERPDIPSLPTEADRHDAEFAAALAGARRRRLRLRGAGDGADDGGLVDRHVQPRGRRARPIGAAPHGGPAGRAGGDRRPGSARGGRPVHRGAVGAAPGGQGGKDFATSDAVRDRLAAAGVEVRDTPEGAEWDLP